MAARDQGLCRVLVINDNWRYIRNADVLYASDTQWWERYHAQLDTTAACWTQCGTAAARYGLNHIPGEHKHGLSATPDRIHFGGNSGHHALNLVANWGARDIALLGYDMQHTGGSVHHFGDHPPGLNNCPAPQRWLPAFDRMAVDCEARGIQVTNCSRATALQCFQQQPLDEWLRSRNQGEENNA